MTNRPPWPSTIIRWIRIKTVDYKTALKRRVRGRSARLTIPDIGMSATGVYTITPGILPQEFPTRGAARQLNEQKTGISVYRGADSRPTSASRNDGQKDTVALLVAAGPRCRREVLACPRSDWPAASARSSGSLESRGLAPDNALELGTIVGLARMQAIAGDEFFAVIGIRRRMRAFARSD